MCVAVQVAERRSMDNGRCLRSRTDGCRIRDMTVWKHSTMTFRTHTSQRRTYMVRPSLLSPREHYSLTQKTGTWDSVHKTRKCALDERVTTPVRWEEDTHHGHVLTSGERHVG